RVRLGEGDAELREEGHRVVEVGPLAAAREVEGPPHDDARGEGGEEGEDGGEPETECGGPARERGSGHRGPPIRQGREQRRGTRAPWYLSLPPRKAGLVRRDAPSGRGTI